jgi:aspartate racemase
MWSFDFAEIEGYQAAGDWETATVSMIDAARSVERGGAQCIVICTNTMHKMAGEVQKAVDIPLIHIGDATANAIKVSGVESPLLLATRYTMEQDFYKGYLHEKHGINVCIPNDEDRTVVHNVIYHELCQGVISRESKQRYLDVIAKALKDGADSVIFGCTEVGLLISQTDFQAPVFDTTELHAIAAVDFALS